ncbi:hypothetical protein ABKV23_18850, partial [Enterobacter mori]
TNLVNADYRENRSMILSGLSLVEKGQPTAEIYNTGSWPKAGYGEAATRHLPHPRKTQFESHLRVDL